MKAPNSLERAAIRHGMTVAELVTTFVERTGTVKGAARLMSASNDKVSYPDVWRWLRENCYTVETGHWAKVHPPAPEREATDCSAPLEPRYEPLDE